MGNTNSNLNYENLEINENENKQSTESNEKLEHNLQPQLIRMQQHVIQLQHQMLQMQSNVRPKDSLINPNTNTNNINNIIDNLDIDFEEATGAEQVLDVNLNVNVNGNGNRNTNKTIKKRKIDEITPEIIEDNHPKDNQKPSDNLSSLANLFNNVLDNSRLNKKQKKDNSFGIDTKNCNIIKALKPIIDIPNFNNKTHPDELYRVEFLDGSYTEKKAIDISDDSLKTQKLTYEHNIKIAFANQNTIPNQTNTVIYTRCSKENDISIETQKQACFKYALKNNMKMLPFGYLEDNGLSGRNGKNLIHGELAFWLSHIPNGSTIIVYSPDRWCRNTLKGLEILDNLSKRNITVHFVTNDIDYNKDITSAQKSMIQSELMTAEKQSNDTSEKIKCTLKRLKDEGHVIGIAPYGFSNIIVNGIRKRIENNDEQENIRKINDKYNDILENFNDYLKEEYIYRNYSSIVKFIMRWCVRTGVKNRKGASFTEAQIKTIIKPK